MFHYFRTVKHMNEFMLQGLDLRNLNSINIQNISKSAIIHGEKHAKLMKAKEFHHWDH